MRKDALGLFWQDEQKIKIKKEVIKRTPPERTWERPDYLPNLEEAEALVLDEFTDMELWQASINGEQLVFDIECYPNYVLFAFRSIQSKKCIYFELSPLWLGTECMDLNKLLWVIQNFCLITFNGKRYDLVISALAVIGHDAEAMWLATQMLIEQKLRDNEVYKFFKAKKLKNINQIDMIELTALKCSLKKAAARLHAPRLQDLPFKPGSYLNDKQALIVRWYCFNDLDNTEILFHSLHEELEVRIETGKIYNLDLRSRSDAQMAEDIIGSEIRKITGRKHIERTSIPAGTTFKFQTPAFIKYESDLMKWVLKTIQGADFIVGEDGKIITPPTMEDFTIQMNKGTYKIGIGGLHSQEKSISHIAGDDYLLIDTDATSYYPILMLNCGLTPPSLGNDFLLVFKGIVVARISAKEAGDIIKALCFKIVVNGTFGKMGSMWSIVYAPNLMIQVTLIGQLSILMLAERFELTGIEVISVNTDGIVVKCHKTRENDFKAIVKAWEHQTGFKTEEMRYKAIYNRDVNNYIAVYETPQKGSLFKGKGVYSKTSASKNAVTEICTKATTEFLLHGTSIEKTIRECKQVSMFTSMREVNGGAVKDGVYLGKIIRWYYSTEAQGEIIYARSGNKVPRSDGGKPLMNLPKEFPTDINYEWYIEESNQFLQQIAYAEAA